MANSSRFWQVLIFNNKNNKVLTFCSILNSLFCAAVSGSCSSSTDCQHGGTCINGTCACPDGYSGTLCETGCIVVPLYNNMK